MKNTPITKKRIAKIFAEREENIIGIEETDCTITIRFSEIVVLSNFFLNAMRSSISSSRYTIRYSGELIVTYFK